MGSDPQIVISYHLSFGSKCMTDCSVDFACGFGQRKRGQPMEKFTQSFKSQVRLGAFCCAIDQFSIRDHRECGLTLTQLAEAP